MPLSTTPTPSGRASGGAADRDLLAVGLGEHVVERGRRCRRRRPRRRPRSPCTTWPPRRCDTAQSTGRPRVSAIDVMLAIASFLTFSPRVPGMSSAVAADGRGGPDVRARRHVGEVGRHRDERPRARRAAAARRDPHDDGHVRLEERAGDVLGRVEAAAGRVELDDHGRGPAMTRPARCRPRGSWPSRCRPCRWPSARRRRRRRPARCPRRRSRAGRSARGTGRAGGRRCVIGATWQRHEYGTAPGERSPAPWRGGLRQA